MLLVKPNTSRTSNAFQNQRSFFFDNFLICLIFIKFFDKTLLKIFLIKQSQILQNIRSRRAWRIRQGVALQIIIFQAAFHDRLCHRLTAVTAHLLVFAENFYGQIYIFGNIQAAVIARIFRIFLRNLVEICWHIYFITLFDENKFVS